MVYGHYDVQPPEPFELWKSPPFEPRIEGRSLFARGASDNKGQNLAHLNAVEAYLKTGTELPCDLTFVIEGEEEVGSKSLAAFLQAIATNWPATPSSFPTPACPAAEHPALTYALRGICAFEITLRGPSRDLHSGIFGGTVDNPAMALCQLLAQAARQERARRHSRLLRRRRAALRLRAKADGAVAVQRARVSRKFLGVPRLFGERGYTFDRAARARGPPSRSTA